MSIFHRFTGLGLALTGMLVVWWFMAAATSPGYFRLVDGLLTSWIGDLVMIVSLAALWYHFCNGIRHLVWDTGAGFELDEVRKGGIAVLGAAGVLTVITLIVGDLREASMQFRTDRQRVQGLGTAGEGTGHWWSQRLTSIALVPLTFCFLFPFARALGSGFERVREVYGHPFNAVVAILFLAVGFHHLQQGIQVVIEDYVHDKPLRTATLLANTLLTWAFALTGIFAVAKIAFA